MVTCQGRWGWKQELACTSGASGASCCFPSGGEVFRHREGFSWKHGVGKDSISIGAGHAGEGDL